jgi:nucleotide-binding universal stress UspA family protein
MAIDSAAPVIAGVDGSPAGYEAAVWAADEARIHGCRLVLVSVNAWPSYLATVARAGSPGWDVEEGRAVARDVLEQARRTVLAAVPGLELSTEVAEGSPAQTLVERSRTAALVVVGRRGDGEFSTLLLGSTATQIAVHAAGPVVVVPEAQPVPTPGGPGVVVGVDIGEHGQEAVGFGFEEAVRRAVPLTAVRAWTLLSEEPAIRSFAPDPEELQAQQRRLLSEALAGWCAKYPDVPVRHWLVRRHTGRALVEASQGASLLVVGARGAGGFAGLLLGSVSDAAVRHAHCPVAVVR